MPEATPHNLKVFGVGLGVILTVFGALAWRKASPNVPYYIGFATAFFVIGMAAPMMLKPVYQVWMKIAGVIAMINTFIVLGFVYYGLITPYAIVMRLTGYDPLDRKWKDGDSYWKARKSRNAQAYEKQF